ncbi:hypothetical protein Tco_0404764, partial [Tanacetum coccineum]
IWEALGGNTCDLDSIWEETAQDCNFTQSGFKDARIVPGDGVAIPNDVVRTYKRRRQYLCDGVRTNYGVICEDMLKDALLELKR